MLRLFLTVSWIQFYFSIIRDILSIFNLIWTTSISWELYISFVWMIYYLWRFIYYSSNLMLILSWSSLIFDNLIWFRICMFISLYLFSKIGSTLLIYLEPSFSLIYNFCCIFMSASIIFLSYSFKWPILLIKTSLR